MAENIDAERAAPDEYENGPEGMPRVKRMPDAVLDCIIQHSLFRYLGGALEGEDRDRLHGLMHDTANEALARISAWPDGRRTPSASIGEDGLPELPERDGDWAGDNWWTADSMRQYARDAVAADRRAREPMTYDEFFAEAERLGCKLPPEMLLPHNSGEAPPQAAQGVKTWQERLLANGNMGNEQYFMREEIAELRAKLARQSRGNRLLPREAFASDDAYAAYLQEWAAPPLSSEQQAAPVCRNCLDFGWEPTVSGPRRPCSFCHTDAGEQQAEKGEK
jgi:hypothetical protein